MVSIAAITREEAHRIHEAFQHTSSDRILVKFSGRTPRLEGSVEMGEQPEGVLTMAMVENVSGI